MPNFFAAASMTVLSIFSSSITIASSMYGVSARLTRKPGEDFTGSGSRSMAPTKASASFSNCASVPSWLTTSTSCSRDTGLKKCSPSSRSGLESVVRRSCSGMLEVLVARIAPGFMTGSRPA